MENLFMGLVGLNSVGNESFWRNNNKKKNWMELVRFGKVWILF